MGILPREFTSREHSTPRPMSRQPETAAGTIILQPNSHRQRQTANHYQSPMPMKVRKAVFPAAGLGTRFLPATKAQPKEMLPLVDKPIIQYGAEEAMASGCDQILII